MIFYPNLYINNVKDIDLELLHTNNIEGLILDVDNTLIDIDRKMLEGLEKWCKHLKENDIKMCIVSNTNKIDKVTRVAKTLDMQFISFAKKPFKKGFKDAMKILDLKPERIAVVGDQITTDIVGGNRVGMFTILTKPIDKRDIFITKIKRPVENIIIKRYLKKLK